MNKIFMNCCFILCVLAIIAIGLIIHNKRQIDIDLLKKELTVCNDRKVPKGAIIKLDNGEEVVIIGNGSFRLESNTVAIIKYVYEESTINKAMENIRSKGTIYFPSDEIKLN